MDGNGEPALGGVAADEVNRTCRRCDYVAHSIQLGDIDIATFHQEEIMSSRGSCTKRLSRLRSSFNHQRRMTQLDR